jgi:hypothetical protein
MDSFTGSYDVIMTLLISGILGALGQGIRVWFGLSELIYKKNFPAIDEVAESSFMSGSIFIGFLAGGLTILANAHPHGFTIESGLMVIACGYIMTDLAECLHFE